MTSAGAVPIAASRASGRLSYSAPTTTPNAGKRRTGTMADNRKYYYLKLKENFFDSDSIVLLEDMKDGILYSNILLKLYLKSLKNGGKLQLDEHIPYTAQMIATLTRHQIGTVERALEIFRQLGLVEQLDSGAFYMTDIELMIGQSSTEAERKRAARLENKALLPPRTKGGHLSDIRPPEIEIELEKEIEIEKEREGETGHPAPAAYGRYNNVILTDTELSGLKTELPDKWEYYIDRLSCHIASTGKQYHSHAATIYKWAQEDTAKGKAAPKQGIPDYSCKEGESL
jgi:predicted phage replisome organizer